MSADRDSGSVDRAKEWIRHLSPAQIAALSSILDAEACHISYISLHDALSGETKTATVKNLESRGMIVTDMIMDRSVRLTSLGRRVAEIIKRAREEGGGEDEA